MVTHLSIVSYVFCMSADPCDMGYTFPCPQFSFRVLELGSIPTNLPCMSNAARDVNVIIRYYLILLHVYARVAFRSRVLFFGFHVRSWLRCGATFVNKMHGVKDVPTLMEF